MWIHLDTSGYFPVVHYSSILILFVLPFKKKYYNCITFDFVRRIVVFDLFCLGSSLLILNLLVLLSAIVYQKWQNYRWLLF